MLVVIGCFFVGSEKFSSLAILVRHRDCWFIFNFILYPGTQQQDVGSDDLLYVFFDTFSQRCRGDDCIFFDFFFLKDKVRKNLWQR